MSNAASLTAGLPKCAQDCISSTQPSSQCSGTDVRCLCSTSDYSLRLGCCLAKNCNTNDQQSAITVTQGICKTVNVNLPDFVSCNADYTSAVDAAIASASTAATAAPSSSSATVATTASRKESTVGSIQPGVVLPSTSTIVSFNGRPLFTGSCTTPNFALVTAGDTFLEYPWVGCSNLYPDCCPFNLQQGGQLSVCPADYTTVGKTGCCPSGYIPYTTTFPGINTPCYTTPILPLVPPGATANAAVSVIRTQLFALQYTVLPSQSTSSSIGTGPIAGIAVGAFTFFAALIGSLLLFFVRRKRRQRDMEREATKSRPVSDVEQVPAPTLRGFGIHTAGDSKKSLGGVAELDSPIVGASAGGPGSPSSWTQQQSPRVWSELGANERVHTPQEMEGDTFIHAYHPALGGGGEGGGVDGAGDHRRESGNDTFKQAGVGGASPASDAVAFSGSALGGMVEEPVESPILGGRSGSGKAEK